MREHGTYACYVWGIEPGNEPGRGCRCEPCRDARRAQDKTRKQRAAPTLVGADKARAHIRTLQAAGVGLKTLAHTAGISNATITKIIYGGPGDRPVTKRIRPETEQAILAVTTAAAKDGVRIPADTYRHVLDELRDRGWTNTSMARAIGCSPGNLPPRSEHVTAGRLRAARNLLELPVPVPADRNGRNANAARRAIAWNNRDADQDTRDQASRDANAQARAHYRAKAEARAQAADQLPTIDLGDLAGQTWRTRAACRTVPTDQLWIFWPNRGDTRAVDAARTVCTHCPVADECVAHAVAAGEHGVWAGTTDRERMAMRSGRRPVAPHLNPRPVDKRRPCGHCGELFLPWAATTRFCSRSCAMRARGGVRLVAS